MGLKARQTYKLTNVVHPLRSSLKFDERWCRQDGWFSSKWQRVNPGSVNTDCPPTGHCRKEQSHAAFRNMGKDTPQLLFIFEPLRWKLNWAENDLTLHSIYLMILLHIRNKFINSSRFSNSEDTAILENIFSRNMKYSVFALAGHIHWQPLVWHKCYTVYSNLKDSSELVEIER